MYSELRFLEQGGEMGRRIREHDWAATPLGPPDTWPQTLRFVLGICLGSQMPTAIYWGPELRLFYNDAWAPIPAERHPAALGQPGRDIWPEIWDVVGPQFEHVLATGEGFATYDQRLDMLRDGVPRETYWNYSFTPIRDEHGRVCGILNQGNETTRTIVAEREGRAEVERLRELFQQSPGAVALLQGRDHVFALANPAYYELTGHRELLGRSVAQALPEVADQGFVDLLDQVFDSGTAYRASGQPVELLRDGVNETRMVDFVFQPIKDTTGATTAIFIEANDVTERVVAETRLRESEERLQLALDAANGVGIWDWDLVHDRVRADARFVRLYGVDPAVAQEGGPVELFFRQIHPDDAARARAAIDTAIRSGDRLNIEYRLIDGDGRIRWVTAQGRCSYDASGRPVRFPGVSSDVTERREAEEAARRTAADLEALTHDQTFLFDLASRQRALDTPDAIMRLSAGALAERLGIDRVGFYRVLGEGAVEFGACVTNGLLPALDGSVRIDMGPANALYRDGITLVTEDSARDPRFAGSDLGRYSPAAVGVPLMRGGAWVATLYANQASPRRWSDKDVALIEAVAQSAWDAVERAVAVIALRESETKFRAIANSIDPMVWSTRPDGYHDYFNDRWYEFTGVPHGSTDGERWTGLFHADDQARIHSLWQHSLATGAPYHIEYRLLHHSGVYRWVLGRAQPVRDATGAITRWFGTCTDIQDIVDAREVLAQSREQLETAVEERTRQLMVAEERLRQAQKMEAVGQLTGGIAHDFNNMLAVIIGSLDMLERRIAQGVTDLDRYIVAARDGATRAAALTQRLLGFARQQPLAPVVLDVNALVSGMIDLLMRTLGEKVTVETRLVSGLPSALADPNLLENVILNLSVNARDAMPDGGRLTIATALRVLDAEAGADLGLPPGDYLALTVGDTGSGMAPDVAARAFDPFFTTKGVGKGTGLGLSQVFGFARQSGGHVGIDTAPGAGTRVTLLLPRHDARPDVKSPAAAERPLTGAPPPGSADEVILVVEDEERVRHHSVEALRELGYTVLQAPDGVEALRVIERSPPIALLFTDVVMPEMTGDELARRAVALQPGLKVLYTSGYTPDEAIIAATPGVAAALIPKPFGVDLLAARVRAALDA
ncbi:PAS domain S-box-containing protein [Sphingomonas sp. BE123]|uniref:PAS domain-containing protein n=1 Tax=Sphingomonas sp. BE123 TaxID=2817842 RepID=UPI002861EE61|nr:PAS domain-containing protein [Sphingomonas sp. BE123]MDR6852717.1 PAS domain S-box-containing protein [Sphingomonas sp. BE123]